MERRPPKAVVFDFDGVIALSEHVHGLAWEDLEAHLKAPPLPAGFLDMGVGRTDGELAQYLAEVWGNGVEGPELLALKRKFYQQRCGREAQLVPGVRDFIADVSDRFPVALATSSSRHDIAPVIAAHELAGFFDAVHTIESIARPKPDPETYLLAGASLGMGPRDMGDVLVFEDSRPGVAAALAAGATVVGVLTTYRQEELPGPHYYINNFSSIEHITHLFRART